MCPTSRPATEGRICFVRIGKESPGSAIKVLNGCIVDVCISVFDVIKFKYDIVFSGTIDKRGIREPACSHLVWGHASMIVKRSAITSRTRCG